MCVSAGITINPRYYTHTHPPDHFAISVLSPGGRDWSGFFLIGFASCLEMEMVRAQCADGDLSDAHLLRVCVCVYIPSTLCLLHPFFWCVDSEKKKPVQLLLLASSFARANKLIRS